MTTEEQANTDDSTVKDSWARHEVDLLLKKHLETESDLIFGDDFDYLGECAKSALKAYDSLCEDDHSGMSISITQGILNDLIERKPLTHLTGEDDEWGEGYDYDDNGVKTYQNRRYGALFKDVYPDGHVQYKDVERFVCFNPGNSHVPFHNGFVNRIVSETDGIPKIEFPYVPPRRPMKIMVEEILTDVRNGDFDAIGILDVNFEKDGVSCSRMINRYFDVSGESPVEITKTEWLKKKETADELKSKYDALFEKYKAENPNAKFSEIERKVLHELRGDEFGQEVDVAPCGGAGGCAGCGGCGA